MLGHRPLFGIKMYFIVRSFTSNMAASDRNLKQISSSYPPVKPEGSEALVWSSEKKKLHLQVFLLTRSNPPTYNSQ